MMKINANLLQDANFLQHLEDTFKLIDQNIEKGTLWNCGITAKGIVVVSKGAGIIEKIVFLVKRLFGFIDTSYASMFELKHTSYASMFEVKQRVRLAELTALTGQITLAQHNLKDLQQKYSDAKKDFDAKSDEVKAVTEKLNNLNTSLKAQTGKMADLEKELATKKKEFEVLEEKLKKIAKEEELEAQLKARREAVHTITQEIVQISTNLGRRHAELIQKIGNTQLGVAGWLSNAEQMIKNKNETLKNCLSRDTWVKPIDEFGVVVNGFRTELVRLSGQIPLISNSDQYVQFLSQLHKIETTGWSEVYYGQTYTVTPDKQSVLQKTILREIRELAELTFTRKQMMALAY